MKKTDKQEAQDQLRDLLEGMKRDLNSRPIERTTVAMAESVLSTMDGMTDMYLERLLDSAGDMDDVERADALRTHMDLLGTMYQRVATFAFARYMVMRGAKRADIIEAARAMSGGKAKVELPDDYDEMSFVQRLLEVDDQDEAN